MQAFMLTVMGACLSGCGGGPARIYPPDIDAAQAAAAAINEFDTDGDQLLSGEEIRACPAMLDALVRYDKDGDQFVSQEEIERRLGELSRNGLTGMYSLMIRVQVRGEPVPGAKVELIPEDFLGSAVKSASGVTSKRGLARPTSISPTDGEPLHGAQPGIYRLAITGPTDEITERYGSGEELGLEVGEHVLGSNIVFNLEAK